MANANLLSTVKQVKVPHSVTLNLSIEEAEVLLFVMRLVGGCPFTSPRQHTDAIEEALDAALPKENNDRAWGVRNDGVYRVDRSCFQFS